MDLNVELSGELEGLNDKITRERAKTIENKYLKDKPKNSKCKIIVL